MTTGQSRLQVWHEELAAMAQDWADGCQWKHGNPERDPKPFPSVGQNIYATTGETTNLYTWEIRQ